jgi:ribokinase
MAALDLIVLGSLNMDILATARTHPEPGETIMGDGLAFLPGGKGLNQAIAAAKWDITPTLIGAVGTDDFGTQLLDYARANNVDVDQITRHADLPTGTALITVADSGENSIVVVSGANARAAANRPALNTIALAQMETPLAETQKLFIHIRETGGTTILNPSPFQDIPKSLLAECDVLILNQTEMAQMTASIPGGDLEAAEWALRKLNYTGRRCYIVTLGAQGCLCSYEGDVEYFPGHEVDAIDTTGAGDCFAGIFAACLAKGFSYSSAAMLANAGAALATTRRGAAQSMPTMDEVHRFIDSSDEED